MNKTQVRDLAMVVGALGVLAGVLAAPRLILGRLDFGWQAPEPGTVLAERRSPDGLVVATMSAGDSIGHYVFALRRGSQIIASREVSSLLGSHPPIVRIDWGPDGARAITTIDYDFGDTVRFEVQRPSHVP